MKIYVNEQGQITQLADSIFVSNATGFDNNIMLYYAGDNYEISYCNISFIRADGMLLKNFMATLETDDDENLYWNLDISENSGILTVAGQLQVSAQLVKATYNDENEITKREIVASVQTAAFVQKNIGLADEEECDRLLDEVITIRDTLSGEINDHENRITNIEDANPLIDFTSVAGSGYGTKYYFDGTTATVPLATGSCVEVPEVVPVTEIEFIADNWTDENEDGEYELAFSALTTGRTDHRYAASLDIASGSGYEQTAGRIFKGSDGSVLLQGVTEPFAGRIILNGGTAQISEGESNVINEVQRNGVALTVTDKSVNVLVPDDAYDLVYDGTTAGDAIDDLYETKQTKIVSRITYFNSYITEPGLMTTEFTSANYGTKTTAVPANTDTTIFRNYYTYTAAARIPANTPISYKAFISRSGNSSSQIGEYTTCLSKFTGDPAVEADRNNTALYEEICLSIPLSIDVKTDGYFIDVGCLVDDEWIFETGDIVCVTWLANLPKAVDVNYTISEAYPSYVQRPEYGTLQSTDSIINNSDVFGVNATEALNSLQLQIGEIGDALDLISGEVI